MLVRANTHPPFARARQWTGLAWLAALSLVASGCMWNASCHRWFFFEDATCFDPSAPPPSCQRVNQGGIMIAGEACLLDAGNCATGVCTSVRAADGGTHGVCTSVCPADCSDAGFQSLAHPRCFEGTCLATCTAGSATPFCPVGTTCVAADGGGICLPYSCPPPSH